MAFKEQPYATEKDAQQIFREASIMRTLAKTCDNILRCYKPICERGLRVHAYGAVPRRPASILQLSGEHGHSKPLRRQEAARGS